MREFFRGWKRKCGLLLLGLACVLAVGLVRSFKEYEFFAFHDKEKSGAYLSVISMRGHVTVNREVHLGGRPVPFYAKFPASPDITCSGFIDIPYLAVMLPLIGLSYWLIISKPRKTEPPIPPKATV